MNYEERVLLLECILRDIRGNWGYDLDRRVKKAKDLATELSIYFDSKFYSILGVISAYEWKIKFEGEKDGRFFRGVFPYGYEEMNTIHNLDYILENKSNKFKKDVNFYLTNSWAIFEDVSE